MPLDQSTGLAVDTTGDTPVGSGHVGFTQLQQLIRQMPARPKPPALHFNYATADTLSAELNEFFSYAESRQWMEYYQTFVRDQRERESQQVLSDNDDDDDNDDGDHELDDPPLDGSYADGDGDARDAGPSSSSGGGARNDEHDSPNYTPGQWHTLTEQQQQQRILVWLDALQGSAAGMRMNAARKLVYVAQGAWYECKTSEEQLEAICRFNRQLLDLGALDCYLAALERARQLLQDAREMPSGSSVVVIGAERLCLEIELYLTLIYLLIESLRHDSSLMYDALGERGPTLAAMLLDTVARLMERSVKGFPVKKLLLTLWKVMLVALGDWHDARSIRDAKRESLQLPSFSDTALPKAYPHDYQYLYEELAKKYPVLIPGEPVSESTYHALSLTGSSTGPASSLLRPIRQRQERIVFGAAGAPDSPEPLIMPYSPAQSPRLDPDTLEYEMIDNAEAIDLLPDYDSEPMDLLPRALAETEQVYHDRLYIPLAALQIAEEAAAMDRVDRGLPALLPSELTQRDSMLFSQPPTESLPAAVVERERRIREFYKQVLPRLEPAFMFFSKVMIATLPNGKSANTAASNKSASTDSEGARQVNTETLDAARHKEIMWKAVSAILLLMLKLCKASHALQHEHISQILVEHNFLPLSLKLLGQQDAVALCRAQNEIPTYCFTHYCTRRTKLKPVVTLEPPLPHEADHRACWRNCFTVMNFLRILQSLAKRRAHRILLMLQYKAPAVIKRVLKVQHEEIQLQAYKVCKSLVPFAGRKWRSIVANMRVITGIYLHCRQDLRDEWLVGGDQEPDNEEAAAQDQAMRVLANFHNMRVYREQPHVPIGASVDDIQALLAQLSLEEEEEEMEEEGEMEGTGEVRQLLAESSDAHALLVRQLQRESEVLDDVDYQRWLDAALVSEAYATEYHFPSQGSQQPLSPVMDRIPTPAPPPYRPVP